MSTIEQALQPLRWLTGEEQRAISVALALASRRADTLGEAAQAAYERCVAWQPAGAAPPAEQLVAAALLHAAHAVAFNGDRAEAWRPVASVLDKLAEEVSASGRLIAGMLYSPKTSASAAAPERVAGLFNLPVETARDEHSAALNSAYTALCGLGGGS